MYLAFTYFFLTYKSIVMFSLAFVIECLGKNYFKV